MEAALALARLFEEQKVERADKGRRRRGVSDKPWGLISSAFTFTQQNLWQILVSFQEELRKFEYVCVCKSVGIDMSVHYVVLSVF